MTRRRMLLVGSLRIGDMPPDHIQNMHLGLYVSEDSFDAIVAAHKTGDEQALRAVLNPVLAAEYACYADTELVEFRSLTYDE